MLRQAAGSGFEKAGSRDSGSQVGVDIARKWETESAIFSKDAHSDVSTQHQAHRGETVTVCHIRLARIAMAVVFESKDVSIQHQAHLRGTVTVCHIRLARIAMAVVFESKGWRGDDAPHSNLPLAGGRRLSWTMSWTLLDVFPYELSIEIWARAADGEGGGGAGKGRGREIPRLRHIQLRRTFRVRPSRLRQQRG
uniref:Uncharacterized protein n=1 Tax=Steinernema glaseri TaxID=37863 RepID=A0A1I8AKJ3_9BILA